MNAQQLAADLSLARALADAGGAFEQFAWKDWSQVAGGKWKSPGGRVLSDAVFQRMRAKGDGPKPSAKDRREERLFGKPGPDTPAVNDAEADRLFGPPGVKLKRPPGRLPKYDPNKPLVAPPTEEDDQYQAQTGLPKKEYLRAAAGVDAMTRMPKGGGNTRLQVTAALGGEPSQATADALRRRLSDKDTSLSTSAADAVTKLAAAVDARRPKGGASPPGPGKPLTADDKAWTAITAAVTPPPAAGGVKPFLRWTAEASGDNKWLTENGYPTVKKVKAADGTTRTQYEVNDGRRTHTYESKAGADAHQAELNGGTLGSPDPAARAAQVKARSVGSTPAEAAGVKAASEMPPLAPAMRQALDKFDAGNAARFGDRASRIFHGAAEAVCRVGQALAHPEMLGLTWGGAVGGGAGGLLGLALGGPVGAAVGTGVGTLMGMAVGDAVGKHWAVPEFRERLKRVAAVAAKMAPAAGAIAAGVAAGAVTWPMGAASAAVVGLPALGIDHHAYDGHGPVTGFLKFLFHAPFDVAHFVYAGLGGDQPAGPVKLAEQPDPVAVVKRMVAGVAQAGGIAPPTVEDSRIRLALLLASAAADGSTDAPAKFADGGRFESFGWDEWSQIAGGKWRSPGGRVLSDAIYQRMKGRGRSGGGGVATAPRPAARPSRPRGGPPPAAAQQPQQPVPPPPAAEAQGKRRLHHRIVGAVGAVNRAAGRLAGAHGHAAHTAVAGRAVRWHADAAAGKYGKLAEWAVSTPLAKATVKLIGRRADRFRTTFAEMQKDGLAKGLWNAAVRIGRVVKKSYFVNRRKYGILAALGIEAAVFGMKAALPAAVGAGIATLTPMLSPIVAGGLATAGTIATAGAERWVMDHLFGLGSGTLIRKAVEGVVDRTNVALRGGRSAAKIAAHAARKAAKKVSSAAVRAHAENGEEAGAPSPVAMAREVRRRLTTEGAPGVPLTTILRAMGQVFDILPAVAAIAAARPATTTAG